ncbi:hypothetical protein [Allorhizobium sonneratiae]|nr:hypothetical protein [Allorhizobium sonneratiae]
MSFASFILVLVGASTAIIAAVAFWPSISAAFVRYIDRRDW